MLHNNIKHHFTEFMKSNLENLEPILKEIMLHFEAAPDGKIDKDNIRKPMGYELYDFEILRRVSSISEALERLKQSQFFIYEFPSQQFSKNYGIGNLQWIEYHFSFYEITFVSIFDMVLLFTNSAFLIGNRELDCKSNIIMNNVWVKDNPVYGALKELQKTIEPHRKNRNLHLHRGYIPEYPTERDYSSLKLIEQIDISGYSDEPFFDEYMWNILNEGQASELAEKMMENTEEMENKLDLLFEGMLPVYQEKSTSLRKDTLERLLKELERRRTDKR